MSRRQPEPFTRDRGKDSRTGYALGGGVPWPTMGDGAAWGDSLQRVQLLERPDQLGKLQSVEWCHPDGGYMPTRTKTLAATKTKPKRELPLEGAWWGLVSWDDPDREDRPAARVLLTDLVEHPAE